MSRPFADESSFRAIAHGARRQVLDMLRVRERPVAELVTSSRLPRSTLSQHLRILRTAGLVKQRRIGRRRVYGLQPAAMRSIRAWIAAYNHL